MACNDIASSDEIDARPTGADVPVWTLLFRLQLQVGYDRAWQVQGAPGGTRSAYPFDGGEFAGPLLRGTVEKMGMDWPSWRQDGSMLIDARLMLRTDDNELIAMTYTGISYMDPARVAEIRNYDPSKADETSDVYGRTTPRFETGADKYYWLNHAIAAAKGRRTQRGPLYSVYAMDIKQPKAKGQI